ncbi:MAG TPA: Xaa-Pro peptidase family protein [Thermoleophilia bacterium]
MDTPGLPISVNEYARRRDRVLEALDGAAAVVLAGTETSSPSLQARWKTDRMFWYLTGLDHESSAALVFDPTAEDPDRRITLFLRPRDPEMERWDGSRDPLGAALKERTGFANISRTNYLPGKLADAARRSKRLACLHPFVSYTADISPDLDIFKKICERIPNVSIEDRTQVLPAMRAVKSPAELALIERAVAATTAGYDAALRFIRPGVAEAKIAETLTAAFLEHDAEPAFGPIVGSGLNGTVLHHIDNDAVVEDGDLIVIDYAAAYRGYASDVTRILPAGGAFTPEQREIYEIVLNANLAAIEAARPEVTITEVQAAAFKVIDRAGYGDYVIHGIGHQLGIEVHDVTPDGPLVVGMVMTIEPGIYLPDRRLGVRIEDDIFLTERGNVNLTAGIPKTVADVEAAMARR